MSQAVKIGDKIIQLAEEFEGLVEVVSNAEWDDPRTKGKDPHAARLKEILKRSGHQDGWAYCMSFCEGIWVLAYTELGADPKVISKIKNLLSPSVMNSFEACQKAGLISKEPQRGAIMFMQSGSKWQGHAGLVRQPASAGLLPTIEANTSPTNPNERDGGAGTGGIFRKKHVLKFDRKASGLWIRGFLNPLPLS